MINILLKELAEKWVETGIWQPLHDALWESGHPYLARHLAKGLCRNLRKGGDRTNCFVGGLVCKDAGEMERSLMDSLSRSWVNAAAYLTDDSVMACTEFR